MAPSERLLVDIGRNGQTSLRARCHPNNNGNGIWADINSNNWTITDNGVADNNGNGIMYEISHNATVKNNLVSGNTGSAV